MKQSEKLNDSYRRGFLQGLFAPITFFTLLAQMAKSKEKTIEIDINPTLEDLELIKFTTTHFKRSSLDSLKFIIDNSAEFLEENIYLKHKLLTLYKAILKENIPAFLISINSCLTVSETMNAEDNLEILNEIKNRLNVIKETSTVFVKIKNNKSINTQAASWRDVLALQADSFQPYKKLVKDYEKTY